MASGRISAASDSPSARTRRPSASVLSTSMVLPLRMREDVAGLDGATAGHVLGDRRDGRHPHVDAEVAAGRQGGQDGGGATHVRLHGDHAVGRLQRQPTRVEGDALADQRHVRDRTAGVGDVGLVAGDEQARGLRPSPGPRRGGPPSRSASIRASSQISRVTPRRVATCSPAIRAITLGVIAARGLVDQVARQADGVGHHGPAPHPLGQRVVLEPETADHDELARTRRASSDL